VLQAIVFTGIVVHLVKTRDTDTKRQSNQHGCLPSLEGDGDKEIEKIYGEIESILTGPTRAAKA
jgi:hypothetical protein